MEGYKTLVDGQPVYIHPSSALFNHNPDVVVVRSRRRPPPAILPPAACLCPLCPQSMGGLGSFGARRLTSDGGCCSTTSWF